MKPGDPKYITYDGFLKVQLSVLVVDELGLSDMG